MVQDRVIRDSSKNKNITIYILGAGDLPSCSWFSETPEDFQKNVYIFPYYAEVYTLEYFRPTYEALKNLVKDIKNGKTIKLKSFYSYFDDLEHLYDKLYDKLLAAKVTDLKNSTLILGENLDKILNGDISFENLELLGIYDPLTMEIKGEYIMLKEISKYGLNKVLKLVGNNLQNNENMYISVDVDVLKDNGSVKYPGGQFSDEDMVDIVSFLGTKGKKC
jgi:hypothetical protein